jgi:selenium-binding protein 1
MKYFQITRLAVLVLALTVLGSCQKSEDLLPQNEEGSMLKSGHKGFVHGIIISVDGEDYYFAGAPDGTDGAYDIPGHYWVQAGPNMLVGKHYNTGPFGAEKWWSSDAPDGEYLYKVHAIIDTWSPEKAETYAEMGYVHYHELVRVSDGKLHPTKVPWLKHTARTSFTLDGGPGAPNPPYEHSVTPGVDYLFPINGTMPYNP